MLSNVLIVLEIFKVLGNNVSALYVVAKRFEKMPDSTHLCIEEVFGYCKVLFRESKRYKFIKASQRYLSSTYLHPLHP